MYATNYLKATDIGHAASQLDAADDGNTSGGQSKKRPVDDEQAYEVLFKRS